jgi:hypothetical protein
LAVTVGGRSCGQMTSVPNYTRRVARARAARPVNGLCPNARPGGNP